MRYSLLSRFRGTLLGAALGEILGIYCGDRLQAKLPLSNLESGQWVTTLSPTVVSSWGSQTAAVAEHLIAGTWHPNLFLPSAAASPRARQTAGLAIAALPLALFCHEDSEKLRDQVDQAIAAVEIDSEQCKSELSGGIRAVSYAIGLALQERLHPPSVIPQAIAALELAASSPLLTQQLEQVQSHLQQNSGLSAVGAALRTGDSTLSASLVLPFALAFYCFLDTPEDFGLALRRCARSPTFFKVSPDELAVVLALTGALSGAYNGFGGIPGEWWRPLDRPSAPPSLVKLWSWAAKDKIEQLASQLLAAWSGAYYPLSDDQFRSRLVTAAPQVIRLR